MSLDSKEINLVNLKGNQPWIFTGRTDVEAPILWPLDEKSRLIGKGPDARKGWAWKEKGATKDEMVGWHHWLNGHEFEQALGDSEEQGSLACCSSWGCKESNTTERLSNEDSGKLGGRDTDFPYDLCPYISPAPPLATFPTGMVCLLVLMNLCRPIIITQSP